MVLPCPPDSMGLHHTASHNQELSHRVRLHPQLAISRHQAALGQGTCVSSALQGSGNQATRSKAPRAAALGPNPEHSFLPDAAKASLQTIWEREHCWARGWQELPSLPMPQFPHL